MIMINNCSSSSNANSAYFPNNSICSHRTAKLAHAMEVVSRQIGKIECNARDVSKFVNQNTTVLPTCTYTNKLCGNYYHQFTLKLLYDSCRRLHLSGTICSISARSEGNMSRTTGDRFFSFEVASDDSETESSSNHETPSNGNDSTIFVKFREQANLASAAAWST